MGMTEKTETICLYPGATGFSLLPRTRASSTEVIRSRCLALLP